MVKTNEVNSGDTLITLHTNVGDIKLVLYTDIAPKTCENFVGLCKNNYYDGITFHRVMNDFMIQGGDPTGTGMGGESIWGEKFEDECSENARHFKGTLSMANSGPNTNGSQFFIVHSSSCDSSLIKQMETFEYPKDIINNYKKLGGTAWLDGKHTVFGMIIDGMNVVDKIAQTKVDRNDRPLNDIIIEKTTIEIAE